MFKPTPELSRVRGTRQDAGLQAIALKHMSRLTSDDSNYKKLR
jgi:hypothetical protein